jgi:hypothetical protein
VIHDILWRQYGQDKENTGATALGVSMPDAPNGNLPGQQPEAAPDQLLRDPSLASPVRQPRTPIWRRRSVLITSIVAVAAAVAAGFLWPGSPPQQYTSPPPPCTLVPAATLAKYMPGATSTPESESLVPGCSWLSNSGQEQTELVVLVVIYNSSSGVTIAEQGFNAEVRTTVSNPSPEVTFTVTRQSVTGVGDQAAAEMYWAKSNVPPLTPGVILHVRSRNADIEVSVNINQAGSAPLPTGPQLLSETIAIARAVLTVLASPPSTER